MAAEHNEGLEKCVYSKPKNEHISNQYCQFYKKSNDCQRFCFFPMEHKGGLYSNFKENMYFILKWYKDFYQNIKILLILKILNLN